MEFGSPVLSPRKRRQLRRMNPKNDGEGETRHGRVQDSQLRRVCKLRTRRQMRAMPSAAVEFGARGDFSLRAQEDRSRGGGNLFHRSDVTVTYFIRLSPVCK